ncbi:hypothetical protein BDK51DRAFT_41419 [Blyttiomyces helicus]|uniref:Uncharacterized protein n=1 Tax=Blyttiomyces helicus TaxID=388810 RepID=A0A4P9WMY4_9FUNG|nr:hypothetical protein BDK51DRAFT_41419 [Blyttiomyces helicus]|eukprot:RKO93048.1 hypothetical protein BDK51DRAFT_41419 [Blyttiomyces helicus]
MLNSKLPADSRLVVLQCMALHKRLQLQQSIVDLAPYGKTQHFCILGAGKSCRAPLRHVTVWEHANSASQWTQSGATSNAVPPRSATVAFSQLLRSEDSWNIMNILSPSQREFTQLLVVPDGSEPGLVTAWSSTSSLPSSDALMHVTPRNSRPAELGEYSMRYTAARPASSFQGTRASQTTASGKAADLALKMTEGEHEARKRGRLAWDIEPSSTIQSDVEKCVLENFEVVPMHVLIPGQVVFHEACEGLDGTPSAHVRHGHNKNRLDYYFSSKTAIFEIPTWRPGPLLIHPDKIIQSPHPFLNYDGLIDVDLRNGQKWTI